jgi:outer membrane immunogenic protein
MKRQPSLAFLALAISLIGTSAWADGWEGKRPIPPACVSPFAGAYLGLAAGYAQQRVEATIEEPQAPAFGQTFSDNEGGFTFGGYVGYNFQRCSRFVFGIETDFNYLGTSPTAYDIEVFPGVGTETSAFESSMDWFGTLRGRLGIAVHNHLLLYATGGLAYGRADHTLSDDCPGCVNGITNLGTVSQSNDFTKAGWTVGGGAELLHDSRWFLRAEALYVDLGSETHYYSFNFPGVGTASTVVKWDDQFWVARVGLSYKFGAREHVVPLK